MTIHEGADLEGLKIELLGRAAQDYIIAYRAKVDDDHNVSRGYIWCLHPKDGMHECYKLFEQVFGADGALMICRELRKRAQAKNPDGTWKRITILKYGGAHAEDI